VGRNDHCIEGTKRLIKFERPRKDPALAALETRLGWPDVVADGCRWIVGEPGNGTWEWCGAPCVADRGGGATAWCADHWRLVYMIGDISVEPDQSILRRAQIEGPREPGQERNIPRSGRR